jgi:hypothetical protein
MKTLLPFSFTASALQPSRLLLLFVLLLGTRAAYSQRQARGTAPQAKMTVCTDGHIQGWGSSNLFGQPSSTVGPVLVHPGVLTNMVAVVPGNPDVAYAINSCGTLYAWGDNSYGKLGLGTTSPAVAVPTPVVIPGQRRVTKVGTGADCAYAVCADGSLWGWGRNNVGQLGIGTTGADQPSPVLISNANIADVQGGEKFAIALTTSGQVLSWGYDQYGELGRGLASGTTSASPAVVYMGGVPLTAKAIEVIGRYSAGVVHTNGGVYCWGRNDFLSLGTGGGNANVPTQTLPGGSSVVDLAANELGAMALLASGQTRIWGLSTTMLGLCSGPSASSTPIAGPTLPAGSSIFNLATDATGIITPSNQLLYVGCGGLPYSGPGGSGSATCNCAVTPLPNALPAKANSISFPATVPITLNTTAATLCAGSSLVLQASGGDGQNYTWAPNIGLSATTGATVVVSPGSTQHYTVTSTNPCGPARTATITVTVNENCCQESDGYDVHIPNGTYNNTPFVGQPGTRYMTDGDLRFETDRYSLEAGETLLMPVDATLTVGTDAELSLAGATITAACEEMWGQLVVAKDAKGLITTSVGSMRSRIQHCLNGVIMEESPQAYFQLRATDFLHNGTSLSLLRAKNSATSNDYVRSCLFDSNPEYFKAPLKYNGPNDYYYTQKHLYIAGDLLPATFTRNRMRHCVFGVVGSNVDGEAASIEMIGGEFSDFYLVGAYNAINPSYNPTWTFVDNLFQFPAEETLPATTQIAEAAAQTVYRASETYGVFVTNEAVVRATGNLFRAPDNSVVRLADSYDQFGQINPRQIGIHGNTLPTLDSNTFEALETGVEQTARPGDASEVTGNTFRECRIGWDLFPVGNVFSGPPYSNPEPELNATCNSFLRDRDRSGTSTGIHIRNWGIPHTQSGGGIVYYYPNVLLRDPSGNPLKNLFDDAGRGPGEFYSIDNEQGGAPLDYYTYVDYYSQVQTYANGNVNVPSNGPGRNTGAGTESCEYVGYAGVGLQARGTVTAPTGPGKAELAQNWPNPCSGSTTFSYATPTTAKQAELLIRRSVDGREIKRLKLNPRNSTIEIPVADWPAGTYFATLVVDGLAGATRRVVVR